jgi:hypothetical protein
MKKILVLISLVTSTLIPLALISAETHNRRTAPVASLPIGAGLGFTQSSELAHGKISQIYPMEEDKITPEKIASQYDRIMQLLPTFTLPLTTPEKAGKAVFPIRMTQVNKSGAIVNTYISQGTLHAIEGVAYIAAPVRTGHYSKVYYLAPSVTTLVDEASERMVNLWVKHKNGISYERLALINTQIKTIEAEYDKVMSPSKVYHLTIKKRQITDKHYTIVKRNGNLFIDSKDAIPLPESEIETFQNSVFYQLLSHWSGILYQIKTKITSETCCVIS